MRESDETLVGKAQAGDRTAFEELVRRTSRLVYARLLLETGDPHRTEDLVQETLLRAYRSIGRLKDPGSLRSWLLIIAQNVLTDAGRKESRQKREAADLNLFPGSGPSPPEEAGQAELRGKVLAVLRSLPEDYRLPLTLRYLAGADYDTIETQLGLSNGALRGLLHRGLKVLRSRLEGFI